MSVLGGAEPTQKKRCFQALHKEFRSSHLRRWLAVLWDAYYTLLQTGPMGLQTQGDMSEGYCKA